MSKIKGKHLISFDEWSKDDIELILDASAELKRKRYAHEITNYLVNQTLFMIFFEQSTRTRNSGGVSPGPCTARSAAMRTCFRPLRPGRA